jgi:AcrB/AcrD/AcrF family
MTSFAFIMGVVPLMLSHGAGAEMRQAIGTAVFWGMLGVTFFGIFFTPVFYALFRTLSVRIRGRNTLSPVQDGVTPEDELKREAEAPPSHH